MKKPTKHAPKKPRFNADGVAAAAIPMERIQYAAEVRYADGGIVSLGMTAPGQTIDHAIDAAKTTALAMAQQHGQPGVWARVVEVGTSPRGERRTVVHEGDIVKQGKGKKAVHSYVHRKAIRSEARPDG